MNPVIGIRLIAADRRMVSSWGRQPETKMKKSLERRAAILKLPEPYQFEIFRQS